MYNRPYPYYSYYHSEPSYYQENVYYDPYIPYQQSYQDMQPPGPESYQQTPFEYYAKPKQPTYWHSGQPYQAAPSNQQPVSNLKAYFQDDNGQMDYDKMFNTVGQLAKTVQQVTPVIQQVGSIIKSFK
jgi:hypothetical protein